VLTNNGLFITPLFDIKITPLQIIFAREFFIHPLVFFVAAILLSLIIINGNDTAYLK
jgi:hypothetical protein